MLPEATPPIIEDVQSNFCIMKSVKVISLQCHILCTYILRHILQINTSIFIILPTPAIMVLIIIIK